MSRLPENLSKNRFRNALPPDNTRVCLHDVQVDKAGADYINATFINGPEMPRQYIAAQVYAPSLSDNHKPQLFSSVQILHLEHS